MCLWYNEQNKKRNDVQILKIHHCQVSFIPFDVAQLNGFRPANIIKISDFFLLSANGYSCDQTVSFNLQVLIKMSASQECRW